MADVQLWSSSKGNNIRKSNLMSPMNNLLTKSHKQCKQLIWTLFDLEKTKQRQVFATKTTNGGTTSQNLHLSMFSTNVW